MKVTIEKQKLDPKTWRRILRDIDDVALLKEVAAECDEKEVYAIINNTFATEEIFHVIYDRYEVNERFAYILGELLRVDIPKSIIHKILNRKCEMLPFDFAKSLAKQKNISTQDLDLLYELYKNHMAIELLAREIAIHPNTSEETLLKMANASKQLLIEVVNNTDVEFMVSLKTE